jgi:mannitol 2-dehydrogenase
VELVGPLPAKDERFRKQYDIYITSLEKKGVRATLENLDTLVD